jgi:predicted ATPase
VILVVEDLQYADDGLLDFLEHLLDWARDVPIFVLTLARPELESRRTGWGVGRRNTTALTLDPLDGTSMAVLIEGLVPGMPVAAKTAIAERAEGVPLYAVETVRMLIDRDVVQPVDGVYRLLADVGQLGVPATLLSLLAARLDALEPEARALVADAAVLGGTFPADALVAVSRQPEAQVLRLLAELVRREVFGVRADPLSPQRGHYGFVQSMFRQVAYDTMSRRERKARHLTVASHLQNAFADQGEEVAEVIAAHLVDALTAIPDAPDVDSLREQAVAMLTRAGERAERTGAPSTATTNYARAAQLLELTGASDADLTAAALHQRAGVTASRSGELVVAMTHHQHAGDIYRQYHQVRDAARADTYVGASLRMQGRPQEARAKLQQALTVLEPDPDADTVEVLHSLAMLESFTGNLAAADRFSVAALVEAQALDAPVGTIARLLGGRALYLSLANRNVEASAYYEEALRRAENAQDSEVIGMVLLNHVDVLVNSDPAAAEAAELSSALADAAAEGLCLRRS